MSKMKKSPKKLSKSKATDKIKKSPRTKKAVS